MGLRQSPAQNHLGSMDLKAVLAGRYSLPSGIAPPPPREARTETGEAGNWAVPPPQGGVDDGSGTQAKYLEQHHAKAPVPLTAARSAPGSDEAASRRWAEMLDTHWAMRSW